MNPFAKAIYPADLRAPWGQTYPSVVHRQPAGSGSGVCALDVSQLHSLFLP